MTTTVANFKPLSYFEWIDYIKQQVKGEYKLQGGYTYSKATGCVYSPNGSLYGINSLLEDDNVYTNVFTECPNCCGEKNYEVFEGCIRHASECCGGCTVTHYCDECDDNGQVLIEEVLKLK